MRGTLISGLYEFRNFLLGLIPKPKKNAARKLLENIAAVQEILSQLVKKIY